MLEHSKPPETLTDANNGSSMGIWLLQEERLQIFHHDQFVSLDLMQSPL